jgi:hypothetical protein
MELAGRYEPKESILVDLEATVLGAFIEIWPAPEQRDRLAIVAMAVAGALRIALAQWRKAQEPTHLRGRHYGQQSCVPRQQPLRPGAEERQLSPCQRGAAHTWRISDAEGRSELRLLSPPTSDILGVRLRGCFPNIMPRIEALAGVAETELGPVIHHGETLLE